jgi:hypothetical protein
MALFIASHKAPILNDLATLIVGGIAVGLTALTNVMGANDLVRTRELAAWELEQGMARYRTDPSFDLPALGKAEERGLEILKSNGLKSRRTVARNDQSISPTNKDAFLGS